MVQFSYNVNMAIEFQNKDFMMCNKQKFMIAIAMLLVLTPTLFLARKQKQLSKAKKYLNHLLIQEIQQNETQKIQELVEAGANVNVVPGSCYEGSFRKTALMVAAQKSDNNLLQWLITHGADVNIETEWDQPHAGKPALSFALEAHNLDGVKILINAGADVNKYNDLGSVENLETIPESLRERNNPLLTYTIGRKLPMSFIHALLNAKNVDVNKSLLNSITPLMIAAAIGYEEAAEALLKAGADATTINPVDGKQAIDYARDAGHKNIVKLLQEKS